MKKVIYRPHCGGLAEAMGKQKSFDDVCEMLDYLVETYDNAFCREEIHLTYYCYDDRIDWETFLVTGDRLYSQKEHGPEVIGFCTFK